MESQKELSLSLELCISLGSVSRCKKNKMVNTGWLDRNMQPNPKSTGDYPLAYPGDTFEWLVLDD